jgi:hypothetical protein
MPANVHLLPPLLIPRDSTSSEHLDVSTESIFPLPLLLVLLIILGSYLFWTISANRFDELFCEDKHTEALTALMAIFTPTKSSWPSDILDATRRAAVFRPRRSSSSASSGLVKGEIRLKFSAVYEHVINGDLELQSTASVDLVKAMLLERDGMEVDGWKIKVIVEWKWVWRISLWVIKGLGSRLTNLSELWTCDDQKVIPATSIEYMRPFLMTARCTEFAPIGYGVPRCTEFVCTSLSCDRNSAHEGPSVLPVGLCSRLAPYLPARHVCSAAVRDVTI